MDPRDSDPRHVPEDVLWDPIARKFVPRHLIIGPIFWAVVGALGMLLVIVAVTNGSGSTPAAPEPSFVAVPGGTIQEEARRPDIRVKVPQPSVSPVRTVTPASPPPPKSTPTPPTLGRHVRTGTATWYDDPRKSGFYAAAGPPLRVGNWRGRLVWVSTGGHAFPVILSDWCACRDRVIDLSPGLFSRFAPLSRGVITVRVTW